MTEAFCSDGKDLALLTVVTAMARTLVASGVLDKRLFVSQLEAGLSALDTKGEDCGAEALRALLPMMKAL